MSLPVSNRNIFDLFQPTQIKQAPDTFDNSTTTKIKPHDNSKKYLAHLPEVDIKPDVQRLASRLTTSAKFDSPHDSIAQVSSGGPSNKKVKYETDTEVSYFYEQPHRLTRESARELRLACNELSRRVEKSKELLYQDGEEIPGRRKQGKDPKIEVTKRKQRYKRLSMVQDQLEAIPCFNNDNKNFSLAMGINLRLHKVGRCDSYCYLSKECWHDMPPSLKKPHMKLATYMYEFMLDGEVIYNHFFQLIKVDSKVHSTDRIKNTVPDVKPERLDSGNTIESSELESPVVVNDPEMSESFNTVMVTGSETLSVGAHGRFPFPPGFRGYYLYDPYFSGHSDTVPTSFYIQNYDNDDFHNFVMMVTKEMGHKVPLSQLRSATLKVKQVDIIDSTPVSPTDRSTIRRLTEQLVISSLIKDFRDPKECHGTLMDCRRLDLLPPSDHFDTHWNSEWDDSWGIPTIRQLIVHQVENRNTKSPEDKQLMKLSSLNEAKDISLPKIAGKIFSEGATTARTKKAFRGHIYDLSCRTVIDEHRNYLRLSELQEEKSRRSLKKLEEDREQKISKMRTPPIMEKKESRGLCLLLIKKIEKRDHINDTSRHGRLYNFKKKYILPNLDLLSRASPERRVLLESEFCHHFGITRDHLDKLYRLTSLEQRKTHEKVEKNQLLRKHTAQMLKLSIIDGLSFLNIKHVLFPNFNFINDDIIGRRINTVIGTLKEAIEKGDNKSIQKVMQLYGLTRSQVFEFADGFEKKKYVGKQKIVIDTALRTDIHSKHELHLKLAEINCKVDRFRAATYLRKFLNMETAEQVKSFCQVKESTAKTWLSKKDKVKAVLDRDAKTMKKIEKHSPEFLEKLKVFSLKHTKSLYALNSRFPNKQLSAQFEGDDIEEVIRRLSEIRRRARRNNEHDRRVLLKSGFNENEIEKLIQQFRAQIPVARSSFVQVIHLMETGQADSFDRAIGLLIRQDHSVSMSDLRAQKDYFLKAGIHKTAEALSEYFDTNIENAVRWKQIKWEDNFTDIPIERASNLRGKKRPHLTVTDVSSIVSEHTESKRQKIADETAIELSSDFGSEHPEPLPSGKERNNSIYLRTHLLGLLYGGNGPVFDQEERIKIQERYPRNVDSVRRWVRHFKEEVKGRKSIHFQATKYKVPKTTIELWRSNLEKESKTDDKHLLVAGFMLDKLYGDNPTSDKLKRANIEKLAEQQFPVSTFRERTAIFTDWDKNTHVYERNVDELAREYNITPEKARTWLDNYYLSGHPFSCASFKSRIVVDAATHFFNIFYASASNVPSMGGTCKAYIDSQPYKPFILKMSDSIFNNWKLKFEKQINQGKTPQEIAQTFHQPIEDINRWISVFKDRQKLLAMPGGSHLIKREKLH
ncbi:hypothetical protein [Endozoicomonas atrinae]|uniref:hypothetical protein n=1 Tax=Endozoicomonas atrinae TaxID=1333660 RepID=UPI000826ACE2|nr:hypothetical protein [Endozoicomonas atrinae]